MYTTSLLPVWVYGTGRYPKSSLQRETQRSVPCVQGVVLCLPAMALLTCHTDAYYFHMHSHVAMDSTLPMPCAWPDLLPCCVLEFSQD